MPYLNLTISVTYTMMKTVMRKCSC